MNAFRNYVLANVNIPATIQKIEAQPDPERFKELYVWLCNLDEYLNRKGVDWSDTRVEEIHEIILE